MPSAAPRPAAASTPGPGISIKLSALHPRYSRAQIERVDDELYPVLKQLALRARRHDIGLNIDAEEADRLELSLDLLERLCFEPELAGWNGIGFVVQAYQKRCPFVVDFLVDLARRSRPSPDGAPGQGRVLGQRDQARPGRRPRRLSGLHAQGLHRRRLPRLRAPPARGAGRDLSAVRDPQRAHAGGDLRARRRRLRSRPGSTSSSACTAWASRSTSRSSADVADGKLGRPCRIYAPVGTHETLLAYLVRRLLENGANTSFVNRIADPTVADRDAGRGPGADGRADRRRAKAAPIGRRIRRSPCRARSTAPTRVNSRGLDLADEDQLAALARRARASGAEVRGRRRRCWPATRERRRRRRRCAIPPTTATSSARCRTRRSPTSRPRSPAPPARPLPGPRPQPERARGNARARRRLCSRPTSRACSACSRARPARPIRTRSPKCARRSTSCASTPPRRGAISPSRRIVPLGPVVCISPWNFPLAIFTGQIAAALVAGNPVLAKPAEQTPLIAAEMVRRALAGRRAARRAAAAARAAARRSARRWSATRGCRA